MIWTNLLSLLMFAQLQGLRCKSGCDLYHYCIRICGPLISGYEWPEVTSNGRWHFTFRPQGGGSVHHSWPLSWLPQNQGRVFWWNSARMVFFLFQSHQKYVPSLSLQVESPAAMGTCQVRYFSRGLSSWQKSVKDERKGEGRYSHIKTPDTNLRSKHMAKGCQVMALVF